MADQALVQMGENSPEQVAFKLMQTIANAEGITFNKNSSGTPATRDWILRTYAQCLYVVRNPSYLDEALSGSFAQ